MKVSDFLLEGVIDEGEGEAKLLTCNVRIGDKKLNINTIHCLDVYDDGDFALRSFLARRNRLVLQRFEWMDDEVECVVRYRGLEDKEKSEYVRRLLKL